MKIGNRTFTWSYSSYALFETCPKQYYHVRIAKDVSDKTARNQEGEDEHKVIEKFFLYGNPLTSKLAHIQPVLSKLEAAPGLRGIEQQLCLNEQYQPTEYRDWANGWLRGKLDFTLTANGVMTYIDWKTGKYRESDDQLLLASLMIFQTYPDVHTVNGALFFLYHDRTYRLTVKRDRALAGWNHFLPTVRAMIKAEQEMNFPPRQGPLCAYCPVASCPFNTNKALKS